MRRTMKIDDHLIGDLLKYTGEKTIPKAVKVAIEEYVREKKTEKLISLSGKIEIADNLRELGELKKDETT